MINKCINFIQHGLFPQACLQCGQLTQRRMALCRNCEAELPQNRQFCRICATPLSQAQQLICATCQSTTPLFHGSRIPLLYREPVSQWIQHFKFHNDLVKGKLLAELFCTGLHKAECASIDALLPVPLHPSRVRQRGYNQALWLARQISRHSGIPVDRRLLVRTRKTLPQHELKHQQRLTNLKNAFQLKRQCNYKKVVIVDDVVTTGSTVNEIARLLTDMGVKNIQVWAIARTVNNK